ncbi:MAG TPA: methyltransferase, partial [Polyangia bacterium]
MPVPARVRRQAAVFARLQSRATGGAHADSLAEAITRLLGNPDSRLSAEEQAALWRYRARGTEPLGVLTSLFVLGQALPASVVRTAFGDDFAGARACGLLEGGVGRALVRAALSLSVHDGRLLFSDRDHADPPSDHVLGATRATLVLERALPRTQLGNVLELGTGAGLLALSLAGHARSVTATDVAPRALALAALNGALAGMTNVTWLRADRFHGLERRRFDFVTGNLPFVISPDRRYVFRDGGLAEDGFLASVISGVGRHLRPGGFALFLGQWIHREDEAEDERLAPWFVAAGCDALVLRLDAEPADTYAARWSGGPAHGLTASARDR